MKGYWAILAIGFLAQGFFSARILVQWILSEKAKKVLSPTLFWVLSLIGSYLLCVYGWLRNDFAIVLGQFISYYIYLYNLKLKGEWAKLNVIIRAILLLTPVVAILFVIDNASQFVSDFLGNEDIPLWLVVFGSSGQILFTFRFIYQIICSARDGVSELPAGFWIISLAGSLLIVSYGIMRLDPVLIVGQSFGLVAYIRNLIIGAKERKRRGEKSTL